MNELKIGTMFVDTSVDQMKVLRNARNKIKRMITK